uniref:Heparan-sulfate 6-O-sulfotransferase n=1 Tax=Macrostomum lignano TaxID=282301 RepID=A0A1I8I9G7_9PLAT
PPVVHWLSAPSLAAPQAAGSHCGCCCHRPAGAPAAGQRLAQQAAAAALPAGIRSTAIAVESIDLAAAAASAVRVRRKWRCSCRNSRGDLWLVSRYSTGWLCGLHADFAALSACVPGQLAALDSDFERPRRLRYVTMLRRPADRFLSEWQHARRGATWRKSQPTCRGAGLRPAGLATAPGAASPWPSSPPAAPTRR